MFFLLKILNVFSARKEPLRFYFSLGLYNMPETNSNTETPTYDLKRYFIRYKLFKLICHFSIFSKYIPFQILSIIFNYNGSVCILKKTA